MYLYIYEGFRGGQGRKEETEQLVRKSLQLYAKETGMELRDSAICISRTVKGKPYFEACPVEFSVSHTEELWVCLMTMDKGPVGVDIQAERKANYQRIAEQYFTEDEQAYLKENEKERFFQIWTRKEAYAKYTGEGIRKSLSDVSTLNAKNLSFIDFSIRAGIKGSCCVEEMSELWIRQI